MGVSKADRGELSAWAAAHTQCAVCEWPGRDPRRRLEIHHIQGGAGRKHDPRNLLMLCSRCHCVLHSGKVCGNFPDLNKSHILWCKQDTDPDNYDPRYLASLRGKVGLGMDPCQPPQYYMDERTLNATRSRRP